MPLDIPKVEYIQGIKEPLHDPKDFMEIFNAIGLVEELKKIDIVLGTWYVLKSGHRFQIMGSGINYQRGSNTEHWNVTVELGILSKSVSLSNIVTHNDGWRVKVFGKMALLNRYDLGKIFECLRIDTGYDRGKEGSNITHKINLIVKKDV